MTPPGSAPERHHVLPLAAALSVVALLAASWVGPAHAATATVELGTAESFAVLAGAAVTDVPVSSLTGDVGVSPATGAAITGLTCEEVDGSIYTVDEAGPACRENDPGLLTTARADQTAAYLDAAGRTPDTTYPDGDDQLGGDQTLVAGVYRFGSAPTANLIGNLTLDGDESSVWVFQATSDLVFAGSSSVTLTGGAQACNVFWQVGSDATLGTDSVVVGTVLAEAGIAARTRASIEGRLMAGTAVTLDMNTITRPGCAEVPDTPTGTPTVTPTGTPTVTPTGTPTVTPTGTPSPVAPTAEPEQPSAAPAPHLTSDGAGTPVAGRPGTPSTPVGSVGPGSDGAGAPQVPVVPVGSVSAGDAGTAATGTGPPSPGVALAGLLAVLAAGALVALRTRRQP